MKRKAWGFACAALGLTLAAGTCFAQDQPSTAKRVGEKIDSAVKSLKRGAKEAGDALQQQYAHAKTAVHNMSVAGRVYARLRWDKALQSAKVDVDVKADGAATLVGTVPDAKAKAKAIELTADTVGVARVVDRLTVAAAETPAPASAAPTKP
jgi:osmotically-inducible protein OsmY